jgi:hypothetical protein
MSLLVVQEVRNKWRNTRFSRDRVLILPTPPQAEIWREIGLDRPGGEPEEEEEDSDDWTDSDDDDDDEGDEEGSGFILRDAVARLHTMTPDQKVVYGVWLDVPLPGPVAKPAFDMMMAVVQREQAQQARLAYRLTGDGETVQTLWSLAAALVALAIDSGEAAKRHAMAGRCLVTMDSLVAAPVSYMMLVVFNDAFGSADLQIHVHDDLTVGDAPGADRTLATVAGSMLLLGR